MAMELNEADRICIDLTMIDGELQEIIPDVRLPEEIRTALVCIDGRIVEDRDSEEVVATVDRLVVRLVRRRRIDKNLMTGLRDLHRFKGKAPPDGGARSVRSERRLVG